MIKTLIILLTQILVVVICLGFLIAPSGYGQTSVPQVDEVKGAFSGKVLDDDGDPVTDAEVTLNGSSRGYSARTDDDGNFSFIENLDAGEYRVGIESVKWVGIKDYRKMPVLFIDPQHPSEREFRLPKACQIELTIEDENGQPVRASVYYQPLAKDDHRNADRAVGGAKGIASIGGLLPGKYEIGVSSESHAMARAVIEVTSPKNIAQKKVVLEQGKSVKGTIVCSDGEPPAGWMLYSLPTWWKFGRYPGGVKIGDDGSFEVPHVSDEETSLSVSIPMGGGMSTSREVIRSAKLLEMKQPLQLRLDYPSPKSMNYLTGTVRWIGAPLNKGIHISGYCAESKHHTSFILESGQKEFKLGPMPKGIYRVSVDSSELEVLNQRKIDGLDDLEHVQIPNPKPLQLALRVRGKPKLQGVVLDAATGKPIDSFRYRVTKTQTLSGPNYVQEDDWKAGVNGEFSTEVVGPGVYQVTVMATGYAIHKSAPVNSDEQPEEVLKFELGRGVSVHGLVVDFNGVPVQGATVRALSMSAGAMPRVMNRFVTKEGSVLTNEDGQFEIPNLQTGMESFRVDHPDYAFIELKDIEITEATEPLTVTLSEGASIFGTVFDAAGKPQANEVLLFQDNYGYGGGDREAGAFGTAVSDESGHYEINHLPTTLVYVSRSEEWSARGVVRQAVSTQNGMRHHLDLGGTTPLSGEFLVNDEPLRSARLQIGGDVPVFGGMKMFGDTTDEGRFTFYGVPVGRWVLYRALDDRGSEWLRVRELDVPPEQRVDLGAIRSQVGTLTVQITTNTGDPPKDLRLDLRESSPSYYFGRDAALLQPRETPQDPFVFSSVAPGDLALVCTLDNQRSVIQHLLVTEQDLNSTVSFLIPQGEETLTIEIRDEVGELSDDTFMLVSQDERLFVYLYPQMLKGEASSYVIESLPSGPYTLRRGNGRHSPVVAEIEVKANQVNTTKLNVASNSDSSLGTARLMTLDENGVYLRCPVEFTSSQSVRQHSGAIELSLVGEAGIYPYRISFPGFETIESTIELKRIYESTSADANRQIVQLKRSK